ncbi:MAG TPA: hypothetical protein VF756_15315 [Thermoanaerobaculia bacterium]
MARVIPIRDPSQVPEPTGSRLGPEDYLPVDILLAVWGHPIRRPDLWRRGGGAGPGSFDFRKWINGSSENHPMLASALWLLMAPEEVMAGRKARDWWRAYLRWQLRVDENAPGTLRFFGGSEVASNVYLGLTWGSVLVCRLWAQRNRDADLLSLTAAYNQRQAALAVLGAAPEPGRRFQPNRKVRGPYRLQIGGRSTPSSYSDDPGSLLLAEMLDWPRRFHPWVERDPLGSYWYLQIAGLLGKDLGIPANTQESWRNAITTAKPEAFDAVIRTLVSPGSQRKPLRFLGPMEILRWPDTVAGVLARVINGNTSAVLASKHDLAARDSVHLWPWKATKSKKLDTGRGWVEEVELRAQSAFLDLREPLPDVPPSRWWVLSETGWRLKREIEPWRKG